MKTDTQIKDFWIRKATEADADVILDFIRSLAIYEKLEHKVTATKELLIETLFVKRHAEVLLGIYHDQPVAFALFFHNVSTFLGKANLYLEDLYVNEPYRGLGFGKSMLIEIARMAVERGCERLDWMCLDWNRDAIRFYRDLGADPMSEWMLFRLQGEALIKVSKNQKG